MQDPLDKMLEVAGKKMGEGFVHYRLKYNPETNEYRLLMDFPISTSLYNRLVERFARISPDMAPPELHVDPKFYGLVAGNKNMAKLLKKIFDDIRRQKGRTIRSARHEIKDIYVLREGGDTRIFMEVQGVGELA